MRTLVLLGLKRLAEVCTTLEEAGVEGEHCLAAAERVAGMEIRNSQSARGAGGPHRRPAHRGELLGVPVEKADSHLPHIASLTRRHVCTVE